MGVSPFIRLRVLTVVQTPIHPLHSFYTTTLTPPFGIWSLHLTCRQVRVPSPSSGKSVRSPQQLSFIALVFALFAPALNAERVVVVAGGGDDLTGPAAACRLHAPFGIDFDHAGNMFVVEMAGGERVLRVDGRGILTAVAGTGEKGDSGDGGPGAQARFNGMHSLAVGPG